MVFNPEVTVRMRGVMEKCSYCVQCIHTTQTTKRNAGEELKDGDVVTACQQSCPTEAIVFGNLNDPEAKVTKLQKNARAYSVLDDLNTKPRTEVPRETAEIRMSKGKRNWKPHEFDSRSNFGSRIFPTISTIARTIRAIAPS